MIKETKRDRLYKLCKRFIEDEGITSAEHIYQSDGLFEIYPEFIEEICKIVGYAESEE